MRAVSAKDAKPLQPEQPKQLYTSKFERFVSYSGGSVGGLVLVVT